MDEGRREEEGRRRARGEAQSRISDMSTRDYPFGCVASGAEVLERARNGDRECTGSGQRRELSTLIGRECERDG